MKLPLVSIVTPTFNQASFLEQTINSIFSQDYPFIEYIVINDGSTDETAYILEKYKNRLKFVNQKNLGQVSALNYGWSLCNGDILGYISSDDLLDNNAISRLVKKLTNNPSLSIVYGDFRLIDESGRNIRDIKTGNFDKKKFLNDLICPIGPGALFKKDVLKQLNGWDKNYPYIADFVFWIRAIERNKFGKVNKIIASFRRHSASGLVRGISVKQSNEIIDFVRSQKSLNNNTTISRAFIFSAFNHLKSGRFYFSLKQVLTSIRYSRSIIFTYFFYALIGAGIYNRIKFNFKKFVQ